MNPFVGTWLRLAGIAQARARMTAGDPLIKPTHIKTRYRMVLTGMPFAASACAQQDEPGPANAEGVEETPSRGPPNPYLKNLPEPEQARFEESAQLRPELRHRQATDWEKAEAFRMHAAENERQWNVQRSEYVYTNLVGPTIPLIAPPRFPLNAVELGRSRAGGRGALCYIIDSQLSPMARIRRYCRNTWAVCA